MPHIGNFGSLELIAAELSQVKISPRTCVTCLCVGLPCMELKSLDLLFLNQSPVQFSLRGCQVAHSHGL